VAQVNAADDSIERYIVRIYAYDPARHERRHVLVAAFDNEAEGMRCVRETHRALLERRAAGLADPREYVTMVCKAAGCDERHRARRIEARLTHCR
jgi:hypothetical protein